MPGVTGVAGTNVVPLTSQSNFPTERVGHPDEAIGGMEIRIVTPSYFEVMGTAISRGRGFTADDTATAPPIAVITQPLANRLFPQGDAVGRLPVSLLAANLIETLLGIADQRADQRIDFVGGGRGLPELARRVDSGEMAVAFSLYPTQIEDVMAVADAGGIMPPKSTWFEPKLADGMVSYVLD